ncbi:MAG: hypothetical protein IBX55_01110 [Methyloprofundus sp.]|nr:hypothetical protein [Methyloprofundus sp.]
MKIGHSILESQLDSRENDWREPFCISFLSQHLPSYILGLNFNSSLEGPVFSVDDKEFERELSKPASCPILKNAAEYVIDEDTVDLEEIQNIINDSVLDLLKDNPSLSSAFNYLKDQGRNVTISRFDNSRMEYLERRVQNLAKVEVSMDTFLTLIDRLIDHNDSDFAQRLANEIGSRELRSAVEQKTIERYKTHLDEVFYIDEMYNKPLQDENEFRTGMA